MNNVLFVSAKTAGNTSGKDILFVNGRAYIDGADKLIAGMISNVYTGEFMVKKFNVQGIMADIVKSGYWARYKSFDHFYDNIVEASKTSSTAVGV